MSPETLMTLINQSIDDIERGDASANWRLIDWLASYYAWHHPKDSERLRPFLRWRNSMVDKPKGTRGLSASETCARARAAAYARSVSMRLKDGDVWVRMRAALLGMGYNPPNDLKDWAFNSINKDKDYTLAKSMYANFCADFDEWSEQQLADNEAYVVFETFDLVRDDPWPINRAPRFRE